MNLELIRKVVKLKAFSLLTIIFFFCLYLVLLFGFPKSPTGGQSWDNIPTALLPISLINDLNFDFNEFEEGKKKIEVNQTIIDNYYFFIVNDSEKVLANFPTFNGVLLIPFFLFVSIFQPEILTITSFYDEKLINTVYLISNFITVITSIILYLIIKKRTQSKFFSLCGVIIFIFCSPIISVSSRFIWQHTFSLLFITGLLYSFELKKNYWVLLFSVLTFLSRPAALILCLPFILGTLYSLYQQKKFLSQIKDNILPILTIFLLVSLQIAYSLHYFKNIYTFAEQYTISRFSANILTGFFGIVFSPAKGLLIYSPIFIFSFLHLFRNLKDPTYKIYASSIFLFILFIAKWDMWYGGWSLGYRLLIELVPLLTILLMDYCHSIKKVASPFIYLLFILFVISFVVNSQITARFGDCGYHGKPNNIDELDNNEKLKRIWLDSPLLRCVNNHTYY